MGYRLPFILHHFVLAICSTHGNHRSADVMCINAEIDITPGEWSDEASLMAEAGEDQRPKRCHCGFWGYVRHSEIESVNKESIYYCGVP